MNSALELSMLVGLGVAVGLSLLALAGALVMGLTRLRALERSREAQVRLFVKLMRCHSAALEEMRAGRRPDSALAEAQEWLVRARRVQHRWLPEVDAEMGAALISHGELLAQLANRPAVPRVLGGPLRRAVGPRVANSWARLRHQANLERLAGRCVDLLDDNRSIEGQARELEPAPSAAVEAPEIGLAR